MNFLSNLLNGISLGCVYAIIAFGYTLLYDMTKAINFAHGDVIMAGVFGVFLCVNCMGFPSWVGIFFSIVLCAALGLLIQMIAYRPFHGVASDWDSKLGILVITIAISGFLQNLSLTLFGAYTKSFRSVLRFRSVHLADDALVISGETILSVLVCLFVFGFLFLFLKKTALGQAIRKLSEDREAAIQAGIEVNRMMAITFVLASAMAAIAGVLLCSVYPSLTPYTGVRPGIKSFVAAMIGGIGSIPGALLGGILLGILERLSKTYFSYDTSEILIFVLLMMILVVKPFGFFGKKHPEKIS